MAKTSTYGRGENRGCVSPLGGASVKRVEIISGGTGAGRPVVRQSPEEAQRQMARQPDVRRVPRRP
jgi:hypothetical protein